jgi:hypothetical protein
MVIPGTSTGDLNDLDLARDATVSKNVRNMDRTASGTTSSYMSLDLILATVQQHYIPRLYRYDAESFAWVLLWLCANYENGKERASLLPLLVNWNSPIISSAFNAKFAFAQIMDEQYKTTPAHEHLREVATQLGEWFCDGKIARRKARRAYDNGDTKVKPTEDDPPKVIVKILDLLNKHQPLPARLNTNLFRQTVQSGSR